MKNAISIILISLLISSFAAGQTKLTENTLRLEKDQKGAKGSPSDMEWITGTWTGKAFGGAVREVWTKPGDGVMIGMFSLVKDGNPIFYEFMTFTVEDESLLLKLKHFHPNLISWEEKEKTTNFRFIKKDGNRYYFSGLTFEKDGEEKLNVYLALTQGEETREEIFEFSRSDQK